MLLPVLLAAMFLCALIPAVMFCVNLGLYKEPPAPGIPARVDVLIPARNEAANIEACVRSVLASTGAEVHALVMDDASTDNTAALVQTLAGQDARVTLLHAAPLPAGWNGKQHACWQLANAATSPLLLFLDADVRLQPEAIARMTAFQQQAGAALVSGFPRQITVTFLEWLLLPLIHFVLLGFLPMANMRRSTKPGFAAGCGQFLLAERAAYFASGGHAGIRETMHDGLRLPRQLREHGHKTDIADLTGLAEVRMYCSARGVWDGLAKNATEGLAAPGRIVPLTLLLLLGQVVPALLCVYLAITSTLLALYEHVTGVGVVVKDWPAAMLFFSGPPLCLALSYLPRLLAARRFRQPLKSALLHPLGVVVLLALQWYALVRKLAGKPTGWRARSYANGSGAEV